MNPTTEHTEHTDSATTTPCSRFRNPTLRSIIWTAWALSLPVASGALLVGNLGLCIACVAVWCATSLYLVILPSRREDAENPNDRRTGAKIALRVSVVFSVLSFLLALVDACAWAPPLPGDLLRLFGAFCVLIGPLLIPVLSVFVLAQRRFLFESGSRRATLFPILFALFSAASWVVGILLFVKATSSC